MTDASKRLGYGGSAEIDGIQVLITGGGMEEADSPSFIEAMDIPPDSNSRSKMLHADGTAGYTASLNFDCTKKAMPLLSVSKLLGRRYSFNMGIHDGENKFVMSDCLATNLSITGAPAGLISVTLAAIARTKKTDSLVANSYLLDYTLTPDDQPMGYWWSGNTDVREWTLAMTQSVEALYLNEDTMDARYLKTGLVEYVLDVTTYAPQDHAKIIIATSEFTLTGVTTAKGYTFGGVTELGLYTHSFNTAASAAVGSGGVIIT